MVQAMVDPFGTAELRRRVLDAWADAPVRFREDANTEEDYALGGYRDRVVVELAQNAADAARRAGGRGRLRLALAGDRFTAANTGAPLTREGVESLAALRASAKRGPADEGATGRFGVGFSAVVAVSDDVTVASRDGAVRWSRERAGEVLREELLETGRARPEFASELERRAGHVPLLRLPFESSARTPEGYDTAVVLVLRDEDSRLRLAGLLRETGQALLLALPDLAEVEIDVDGAVRVLRSDRLPGGGLVTWVCDESGERATHWRTVTRTGRFTAAELADRPTEERGRPDWSVTWAVAVDDTGNVAGLPADVPRVLHAPTPSDAELRLPALLVATLPLTPDRRHVAFGPAADVVIGAAAAAYADLLRGLPPRTTWDLLPVPLLGAAGEFDARFRALATDALHETPFLVTAHGEPVRPRDAVVLDAGPETVEALADVIPNLLPGDWNFRHSGLAHLRLRRLTLAELADLLADLDREPAWWARLYAALRAAGQRGADLGELGALPVPLADGRLVRGPRGLLVPAGEGFRPETLDPHALAPLGLRIAHPEAVDPLLLRLGAVEADERAVLTDPMTRAAVENSLEADDPDHIAAAVLELVSASGTTVDDAPWLAELALRDDEGGYSLSGELLLPDSPLRGIFAEDAPFGVVAEDLVGRYGAETLEAVGVQRSFSLFTLRDVTLGDALTESLDELEPDGIDEWAAEVAERLGDPDLPPVVPELVGVRDLEFVRADRWREALALLAAPRIRAAVVDPVRVLGPYGRSVDVPSYTAWWLRTGALLDGRPPVELRAADAEEALAGLYDEAPADLDPVLARALGVRASLTDLLAEPDGPDELLERLGEPERHVSREALRRIWSAVAEVDAERVAPPETVRAVHGGAIVVADAEDTVVVDSPALLPLLADRPVLLVPAERAAALADVLDIALASEVLPGRVTSAGEVRPVPDEVRVFLDTAALTYVHHDPLTVDGTEVEWWCNGTAVHAGTTDGLARALAWSADRWSRRHVVAAVLRDPRAVAELLAETDLESASGQAPELGPR
ncbi:sacsin N-terminal ATP-binding-like domain-containing protein [Marinitenerispora sediminis]|uniref:ATP-binding protein n=1 Tax=Marinitenerispora sediminis TaxID=1931232 RepID=A0A368T6I1_9ACTN|nr:ATP-binding protein [Marinitenerispora sediminis]RCV54879.1 ATP-binding protein [Marinitenerispora sediminis]RCV59258.1 ATP-binding protein [Marinitenerispora sediminis]RCV60280.1 ATP-binding protein [Marinitenerispora sediminis]